MKKYIIALLEKWSCRHEWEKTHMTRVWPEDATKEHMETRNPLHHELILICKNCGKIKKITL